MAHSKMQVKASYKSPINLTTTVSNPLVANLSSMYTPLAYICVPYAYIYILHTHIHVCTHICMYTHVHTYMYTHIRTAAQAVCTLAQRALSMPQVVSSVCRGAVAASVYPCMQRSGGTAWSWGSSLMPLPGAWWHQAWIPSSGLHLPLALLALGQHSECSHSCEAFRP